MLLCRDDKMIMYVNLFFINHFNFEVQYIPKYTKIRQNSFNFITIYLET